MKNFIGLAPIVIWIVLTIYTALYIMVEINLMIDAHYFNFILLAVTIISFLFGNKIGQLICFCSLFIGLFGKSTFLVYYHWFKIGGLTLSWIYLPLIIFFLFINYEVIGYWLERFFKKEN